MTKISKDLLDQLASLGLSEREAKLYVLLFAAEMPLGAGKLVTQTGWHRQYVYTSLRQLEILGLIQSATVRNRQKFSIASHDALLTLASRQTKVAKEATKTLLALAKQERAQDFQVFQGVDSFVRHEFKELENSSIGGMWRIIGCDGDQFDEVMGNDLAEFDRLRDKKQLTVRYIGAEAQREILEKIKQIRPLFEYKIIPAFAESSCVTLIRENSVSTRSYADPVLNYELYSQAAARGQKHFFDALWELCG